MTFIKNIIFDLGGVILNIDFQKTMDAIRALGITNIEEIYTGYKQNHFFDAYDKGEISDPEFLRTLNKQFPLPVSNEQILDAWNAMILDFPADRIALLKKLKNKYRLFLLSNTNSIHFPVYNKLLKENYGMEDLSGFFEKVYYSFKIGLRKPDAEIFNHVLHENELKPEECLFIDDSPLNTVAAEKLGMQTLLFNAEDSLENELMKKLEIHFE